MSLTRHGHHVPGTSRSRNEEALADPQSCGGPDSCDVCKEDTRRVRKYLEDLNIPLTED